MKKQVLFPILVMLFSLPALSQPKEKGMRVIPAPVMAAFEKKYPDTKVKWGREGAGYEANFTHEGKSMSANFDTAGHLLETETEITLQELPSAVQRYITAHYQTSKIKEAAKIVKADGSLNYEAEVKGKDLIFDESGKFVGR